MVRSHNCSVLVLAFLTIISLVLLELNVAIENLTKLVPDENKRKFFVRVFKWVVAFATWKYGPKSASAEVENLQSTFGDENPAKGVVGRLASLYFSDDH